MKRLLNPIDSATIAEWVKGEHIGHVVAIDGAGSLGNGQPGEIGFLSEASYREQLAKSQLSAVIVDQQSDDPITQIVVENVRSAWRVVSERLLALGAQERPHGISPAAHIDPGAQIGNAVSVGVGAVICAGAVIGYGASIAAQAFIDEGVQIGEDSHIGPGARIMQGTRIGARCQILANAVIGERGFGNVFEDGHWKALPQLGGVRIGDDVEVGAGTMIDRGAIDDTVIGNGVKLDNLIQIAHNVIIGDHTAIAGCCVIAGSVTFGKYCIVGGGTVFNGHITICDGAHFTGHSSISKSITQPGVYSSAMPVMPANQWKRFVAKLRIFGREK